MLSVAGVKQIGDVRRFPSSRRHPQFNRGALTAALAGAAIGYTHFPDLGGRRDPQPDSPNLGWREAAFRGYADYMQTAQFQRALEQLLELAAGEPLAMMCAEASWHSCHRALIADTLKLRGIDVVHLVDANRNETHPYTAPARIVDGQLTYLAPETVQRELDL